MPKYAMTESEKDLMFPLRLKYPAPSYALLAQIEVPVPGESARSRTVDALAVGSWKSRETAIIGFELKSNRSSWRSELADPKKAEDWAKFCDQWYVVAHQGIVRPEEVPSKWGFYELHREGLVLLKPAARLSSSEPTREMFFSVFQAFMYQLNVVPEKDVLDRRYSEGFRDGEERAKKYFLDALSDLRSDQPRKSDLVELERLLRIGPHATRQERIRLVERMVSLFTQWNSMRPTENAVKAIEFISRGGLGEISGKLCGIKEELQALLSDVEGHEKIVAAVAKEALNACVPRIEAEKP